MNVFSFIKEQVAILDVIQAYTTLKKAGLYWKGHCPFHSEKTASFTVSPHKEIFYCFGCHVHGDVISFIEKIENCTTIQAVQFLSERYAIDLPEMEGYKKDQTEKQHYFHICETVALWCHKQLLKSASAQAYIHKRTINKNSINAYLIGYFAGGRNSIKMFLLDMKKEYILESDLIDAHILIDGKTMSYSPFEDRLIFPIKDHLGRFCGFGGRIFKPNDTRVKYYNSREGKYFNKGKLLFGLDSAKKEIQKTGIVYLVEGYTDCIAMTQSGYQNTVATLGTACTLHALQQLSRYAIKLIVVYDADSAGTHALLRLAELCWEVALELDVIQLPEGHDPASFLLKNSLKPLIEQAQNIFSFFISVVSKDFNKKTLSEKLKAAHKIIAVIHKIPDPLKRNLLLQKASTMLELPLESIQVPSKVRKTRATLPITKEAPQESAQESSIKKLSKKIFFAIIQNTMLLKHSHIKYVGSFLMEPLRSFINRLKELQDTQTEPIGFTQFFDTLNEQEQQIVSRVVLEIDDEPQQTLDELVSQLQKKQWKLTVQNVKKRLELAKEQQDQEQVALLLKELISLKKKMVGKDLI